MIVSAGSSGVSWKLKKKKEVVTLGFRPFKQLQKNVRFFSILTAAHAGSWGQLAFCSVLEMAGLGQYRVF